MIRPDPAVRRHPTGVPILDQMLGGGLPVGGAILILGPSGVGKTVFLLQTVRTALA